MQDNRSNSPRSYSKWFIPAAGVLVLIVVMVSGTEFYLESRLRKWIRDQAQTVAGNRYTFHMDDLQLSLWQQRVTGSDLHLVPVSSADDSANVVNARIESIKIDGLGIFSYLANGSISLGTVSIEHPLVIVQGSLQNQGRFWESLPTLSSQNAVSKIHIDHFRLSNASGRLLYPSDTTNQVAADHIELLIDDITVDSTTLASVLFFRYGTFKAKASGLSRRTPEDYYDITLYSLTASSVDSSITFDSLTVQPRYPKYTFSQHFGYEADRVILNIPKIEFREIDFQSLFEKRLDAELLHLQQANLEIFHNKRMPFPPRPPRPLPYEILKNLSWTINLDTIAVTQSRITYSEHLPRVNHPGHITFGDINATFFHVANDSATASSKQPMILEAQTSVMDTAPLQVRATFPTDDTVPHHVSGTLGSMRMDVLNPTLEPLGFMSIETGQINSMKFEMHLTPKEATGRVIMKYRNLKIDVLDREKVFEEESQQLLSFLANTFKIKSSNRKKPLREGGVSFERDPQKSIFNYWWKALLSGLKSSIGL